MIVRGVIVRGVIVRGVIVRGVIVRGVIVRGVIVRGPILRGPIVRGPIVRGPILLGSIVAGSILLAACGSVSAVSPGAVSPGAVSPGAGSPGAASAMPAQSSRSPRATASPDPVPLCRDAAGLTGVEIVREQGVRQPQVRIPFPGQVTVRDPVRVREVARALCGLPAMPPGVMNCPALFPGTVYQLRFTVNGRRLPVATIEATGCETVTGVGMVRRAGSPEFWRLLATAAGLSPPGRPVFSGTSVNGTDCQPPSTRVGQNGCPGVAAPGG